MEIAVENMRHLKNKGNLRAFCDVRLKTEDGDWVIRGCRIIQQTGKAAWFSLPVVSWQDETGKVRYKTIMELPSGIKKRISEAALEMYYKLQNLAA